MMIENRDRAPASELDRVTAEAASIYLQKVTALAKKNFDTFIGEMDGVLRKLDAMKAEPDEAAEG